MKNLGERIAAALRRFLYGRNGVDQLTWAVLTASFITFFIARLAGVPWLMPLYYIGIIYCLFRTLSKNIYQRQKENQWLVLRLNKLAGRFKVRLQIIKDSRNYRHIRCPNCGSKLRVPRGRGRIAISCRKCGGKFIRKV
ncbi:MAG: hypothetical protein LBC56_02555 [Oscillospiraceae bacterium]|nr:hypothetical protein [Oscillospiraceae bacterium]